MRVVDGRQFPARPAGGGGEIYPLEGLPGLGCGRLEQAEFLAAGWDEWTDREIGMVRELIGDLVFLIRTLLREHEVRDTGECRICASPWPCRVVTTIHLIATDPERQLAVLTQRTGDGV